MLPRARGRNERNERNERALFESLGRRFGSINSYREREREREELAERIDAISNAIR